jgi:hypothetical protein
METGFNIRYFKDAERLLRFAMLLTLLIAGISKFYSHGSFHDYYLSQFTRTTLRLQLPGAIYNVYLHLIPYIEVLLALALLLSKYRRYVIIAWVLYFISLETGHYILEEFATVNGIIPYILLGAATYVLPAHSSLIRRD